MPFVRTPAKLNLFLNLCGQRPDGFHEVQFVMQTISLFDELTVEKDWDNVSYTLTSNYAPFMQEPQHNLVIKAYFRFFHYLEQEPVPVKIHLEKNIPMEAGLGGGSSNAAGMLKVLNLMLGFPLTKAQLAEIAATLGSDVPFFLTGGTAIATGRGQHIQPVEPPLGDLPLVLVYPKGKGVSTGQAYQWVREVGTYETREISPLVEQLGPGCTPEILNPLLLNDFEPVVYAHCPNIAHIAETLRGLGLARPILCGSGATVCGFLPSGEGLDLPAFCRGLENVFPPADYRFIFAETGVY